MSDDRTIHERMIDIVGALPAIGKNHHNQQQGFAFRSVDDAVNALNPLLAEHGVHFMPRCLDREVEKRETRNGSVMHVIHLHIAFRFYGRKGDSVVASMWGEGSDSGDKATSKSATMAEKSALLQVFAIATEEGQRNDPDRHTPEETVSATAVVQERFSALGESEKELLRGPWKAAGLPAPARLRAGQVREALRLLDELAVDGRPFADSEKGGSTSSIHASASSEATDVAGELNQLPGTTTPKDAA